MEWVQAITIIGSLGSFIVWMVKRFDRDVEKIHRDLVKMGDRIDKNGERTDKLYEMFIDLLREKK